MDLLFQVNLAHGKISDVDPSATTHAEVLAQYSAQVERENSLEEGTLKHAITAAVPFSRREPNSRSSTLAPASPNMLLSNTFGSEGGKYVLDVNPEFLRYFVPRSSLKKKNKKKKKNTRGGSEIGSIDKSVDHTDDDDRNIASEAQVQSSSADVERTLLVMKGMMEEMQKKMEDERIQAEAKMSQMEDERKQAKAKMSEMEAKMNEMEAEMKDEREQAKADIRAVEDGTSKLVESLQRELDAVKETADDTAEWIATGCPNDSEVLRRIKLRNLLDRVQARLAFYIGLSTQPYTRKASGLWRQKLEGSTTTQRIASARALLEGTLPTQSESVKSALRDLMLSAEAMEMAVELRSKLRQSGDEVAHYNLTQPQFSAVVREYCQKGGKYEDGLNAFIKFLFT